ncbi:MAG TPA: peroxiredoxin [Kofleriaceae bacterium]|nr:peroxiredoxin [Kofleriaceae bacterium]
MTRSDNLYEVPTGLPVPIDDGACRHLPGMAVAPCVLTSTRGREVSLRDACMGKRVVVFAYPRTGRPDRDPPPGWNAIPGARGCTPQTCGFRDRYQELTSLGALVFGLSTQDTDYQQEVAGRLGLPFELLSDTQLELTRAMQLPTFSVEGMTLLKRFTLILRDGRVEEVLYPVFPPDESASEVVRWLTAAEARAR